jgi:hypothetical protein
MFMMKKNELLAALRGGKYTQGHQYLRHGDMFNVHGVYCDILDSSLWKLIGNVWTWNSNAGMIPQCEKYGLSFEDQQMIHYLDLEKKFCFTRIAKWIEKNVN